MCDFANFDNRRKIEIRNERLLGIPVLYLQVYCTLHNKNKKTVRTRERLSLRTRTEQYD